MIVALVVTSFGILLIACFLRWRASRLRAALNITGEIAYWDGGINETVFSSGEYALTGKPDYILKDGTHLIPVERKSRSLGLNTPYSGEILQLAAYCLLVEE